jgi:hypothetical protein
MMRFPLLICNKWHKMFWHLFHYTQHKIEIPDAQCLALPCSLLEAFCQNLQIYCHIIVSSLHFDISSTASYARRTDGRSFIFSYTKVTFHFYFCAN